MSWSAAMNSMSWRHYPDFEQRKAMRKERLNDLLTKSVQGCSPEMSMQQGKKESADDPKLSVDTSRSKNKASNEFVRKFETKIEPKETEGVPQDKEEKNNKEGKAISYKVDHNENLKLNSGEKDKKSGKKQTRHKISSGSETDSSDLTYNERNCTKGHHRHRYHHDNHYGIEEQLENWNWFVQQEITLMHSILMQQQALQQQISFMQQHAYLYPWMGQCYPSMFQLYPLPSFGSSSSSSSDSDSESDSDSSSSSDSEYSD